MGLIDKGKEFLGMNKKKEKQISEENNMATSKFQGNSDNILDYTKVQQAFNKTKKNSNDISAMSSLISLLKNFSKNFNHLEDDKKQNELKSDKFKRLSQDLKSLQKEDISKIVTEMESQLKLSDTEKLDREMNTIKEILLRLEEDNLQSKEDIADMVKSKKEIDKISKIVNNSFWTTLKQSIPIPKIDLTQITQKIDATKNELKQNKNDINNSNQALSKKIDNIKFPTPQKIPTDYLKRDDFEFTLNDKLKDLKEIKESSENLETVPAKVNIIEKELKNISEKIDKLPSSNGSQTLTHIPKEEKSVIELAKYMTDGVAQFENIAKEYISKISELEQLDTLKQNHQKKLDTLKKDEFENGKQVGKIELIKKLAENFPTEFKSIKSTFEDLIEEKYAKDEILEINDSNKNDHTSFIENKIDNATYIVTSPAILVNDEILFKANVCLKKDDKPQKEHK